MEYIGQKRIYQIGKEKGKGGEGRVLEILGDEKYLIKEYFFHPNESQERYLKEQKISYMLSHPLKEETLKNLSWPFDILYDKTNKFIGYSMLNCLFSKKLIDIYPYNPSKKADFSYKQKVIIGINIATLLEEIHEGNYIIGDFNPQNVMIDRYSCHVFFIDVDSFHIKDSFGNTLFSCEVGCNGFLAPEIIKAMKKNNNQKGVLPYSQESDNFALAIHLFHLLFNGFDPFNGLGNKQNPSSVNLLQGNEAIEANNYCFKSGYKHSSLAVPHLDILPKYLANLFQEAFIDGFYEPKKRPEAKTWKEALKSYLMELKECSFNDSHFYHKSLLTCPYCEVDNLFCQKLSLPLYKPSKNNINQNNLYNQNFITPLKKYPKPKHKKLKISHSKFQKVDKGRISLSDKAKLIIGFSIIGFIIFMFLLPAIISATFNR